MRNKLKKATFKIFSDKGYNASLSEIADYVGIKKPSIYNHYKNKDELIKVVIEEEVTHFFRFQQQAILKNEDLSSTERLKRVFYDIIGYYDNIDKLKFWRHLFLIDSDDLKMHIQDIISRQERKLYKQAYALLEDILKESNYEQETIMPLLHTMIALIHGLIDRNMFDYQEIDRNTLVDNVWLIYWKSVASLIK